MERTAGLSGAQILARMNSQTPNGQMEFVGAVLGYTIRSSYLMLHSFRLPSGTSAADLPGRDGVTSRKGLLRTLRQDCA
jgi:hypothetical protein